MKIWNGRCVCPNLFSNPGFFKWIILLFIWNGFGYAHGQDSTSKQKVIKTIYFYVPITEGIFYLSDPDYFIYKNKLKRFFQQQSIGYGISPNNKTEYFTRLTVFPFNSIFRHKFKHDETYFTPGSSAPHRSYFLKLMLEKRWFALKKYDFQPWFGLNTSLDYSRGNAYAYGQNFEGRYYKSKIMANTLGLSLGFKYSYKKWQITSNIELAKVTMNKSLQKGYKTQYDRPGFYGNILFLVGYRLHWAIDRLSKHLFLN